MARPRLCLSCLKDLNEETYGLLFSFGVCGVCQHFGITTDAEKAVEEYKPKKNTLMGAKSERITL